MRDSGVVYSGIEVAVAGGFAEVGAIRWFTVVGGAGLCNGFECYSKHGVTNTLEVLSSRDRPEALGYLLRRHARPAR
jgi:hypothetical protein